MGLGHFCVCEAEGDNCSTTRPASAEGCREEALSELDGVAKATARQEKRGRVPEETQYIRECSLTQA